MSSLPSSASTITSTSSTPPRAVVTKAKLRQYSPYTGVTYNKSHRRFQSCITDKKRQHFLGRFLTSSEGARAYDVAAKRLKGSGWKLNFLTDLEYTTAYNAEIEAIKSNTTEVISTSRKKNITDGADKLKKKRVRSKKQDIGDMGNPTTTFEKRRRISKTDSVLPVIEFSNGDDATVSTLSSDNSTRNYDGEDDISGGFRCYEEGCVEDADEIYYFARVLSTIFMDGKI